MYNDELKEAPSFPNPSSPVVSGTSLLRCLPHAHTAYFGNSRVPLNFSKQSRHLFEIKKIILVSERKILKNFVFTSYYAPFHQEYLKKFKKIIHITGN